MTEEAQAIETEPASEPGPIDAASVVSKPPEERPAPDSSILANRLESLMQSQAPQAPPEPSMEERILQALGGAQKPAEAPQAPEAVSPELKALREKLATMEEQQQTLQSRLEDRQRQQEWAEASKEVVDWVSAQPEAYPLINKLGHQALVPQKMWNTRQQTGRMMSESEATREIEEELKGIVMVAAPLMGYVLSEQTAASDQPVNESISLTTDGLNISEPVDRDKMTDQEWQDYLIRQIQG